MFVRSILALSLSCILSGTAFAANTNAEQPLAPKKVNQVNAIQDPIDPLAVDSTTASSGGEAKISQQEQQDLNQAASTLQNLESTEDKTADIGAAPASTAPTFTPNETASSEPATTATQAPVS